MSEVYGPRFQAPTHSLLYESCRTESPPPDNTLLRHQRTFEDLRRYASVDFRPESPYNDSRRYYPDPNDHDSYISGIPATSANSQRYSDSDDAFESMRHPVEGEMTAGTAKVFEGEERTLPVTRSYRHIEVNVRGHTAEQDTIVKLELQNSDLPDIQMNCSEATRPTQVEVNLTGLEACKTGYSIAPGRDKRISANDIVEAIIRQEGNK